MKRFLLCFGWLFLISTSTPTFAQSQNTLQSQEENTGTQKTMLIQVHTENKNITVFKLNDSSAARGLYAQLPLTIKVEDYSSNEKIFYPPKKLGTANTPLADAKAGTLAYFAPWGNVVLFYDRFGSYKGLYALGEAISGAEYIRHMSGTIRVEKSAPLD